MPAKYYHEDYLVMLVDRNKEDFEPLERYDGMGTPIKHRHNLEGCLRVFPARPYDLLNSKGGCPYCSGVAQWTHEDYLKWLFDNKRTDVVPLDRYVKGTKPIRHQCTDPDCKRIWYISPVNIRQGGKCKCLHWNYIPTTAQYKQQLLDKGIDYLVPIDEYIDIKTPIKHQCTDQNCRHIWKASPGNIKQGSGCPKCNVRYMDTDKYKKRLITEGRLDLVPIEEFTGTSSPIKHLCTNPNCLHVWPVSPGSILYHGTGCPICVGRKISRAALSWFKSFKTTYPDLQYEYLIPGTRWSVDAYSPSTRTVFEYLGVYWHGSPRKYPHDKIVAAGQGTCLEVYNKTMARLRALHKLGYTVIYTWEKVDVLLGHVTIKLVNRKPKKYKLSNVKAPKKLTQEESFTAVYNRAKQESAKRKKKRYSKR